MRQSVDPRRTPWPPGAYASEDPEWVDYLHKVYYIAGLLFAADRGDQAIAALCSAATDPTTGPRLS